MPEELLVADGVPPLSQGMRVVDTFVAPSKTFTDILRSANCWLPLLLVILISIAYAYTMDKKVGFETVSAVQMSKNPKAEERMASMPADQRAKSVAITTKATRVFTYVGFIFALIIFAVEALILWGSFNFALGAETSYPRVFAVVTFAALPRALLLPLLSIVLMSAGVGTDNFDIRNPVGTNIGYYLTDSAPWLKAAGTFFDLLGFWSLALLVIGMAIISRKTIAQSATIVIGWWTLILLLVVGFTAAFS